MTELDSLISRLEWRNEHPEGMCQGFCIRTNNGTIDIEVPYMETEDIRGFVISKLNNLTM